jgi:hypothetical protein
MKRYSLIFLLLVTLLAACGKLEVSVDRTPTPNLSITATVGAMATQNARLSTQVATLDPVAQPLSLDTDSETIRIKMLRSYTYWRSIFVDATSIGNYVQLDGQPAQYFHEQLWIHQEVPAFRRLNGSTNEAPLHFAVSDGQTILDMDLKTGTAQTSQFPPYAREAYNPPEFLSDTVEPHPLTGIIGSVVGDMVFPSGLAQRDGTYKPVGMDTIAGRTCLEVDWIMADGSRPARYCLDVETAIILRAQDFGKSGGDVIMNQSVVNQVAYDVLFEPALFSLTPSVMPNWGNEMGVSLVATPTPVPPMEGVDPLGQVYFFINDNAYPTANIQLVRLPGSCVAGKAACPALERLETPFALKFNMEPLVWSRDGSLAAFAYPISEDGNLAGLFTFNPGTKAWNKLIEFNFIDTVMWSLDGNWISFREQDGLGAVNYYAIHPDGSGLVNLSTAEGLPEEGRPYAVDGWTSDYVIMRSGRPGQDAIVYLVKAEDQTVRPMFNAFLTKAPFLPSPDGSLLAYNETDYETLVSTLRVIAPDGSGLRDLATFTNASLWPIVWSPDINYLAFAVTRQDNPTSYDVYIIRRDGRELAQVYHGGGVHSLAFSPDGQYLLVEDMDVSGFHLYVVDRQTYQYHILQAPDLLLTMGWQQPSWRR